MKARISVLLTCLGLAFALPASAAAEDPAFFDWSSLAPGLVTGEYSPSSENACLAGRLSCVRALVNAMARRYRPLEAACDHDAMFALLYLRVTEQYLRTVEADPAFFADTRWVNHEDVVFANLYFQAYDAHAAGRAPDVPGAWAVALKAAAERKVSGTGNMLLGANAHIQRDLPLTLYRLGLVAPDGSSRKADHDMVNQILNRAYDDAIADAAARLDPSVTSKFPGTTDETGSFQVIASWRETAWRNAERLATAPDEATRTRVAGEIEEYATAQAISLRSGTAYGPLDSSAKRDAYCAEQAAGGA